MKKIFSILSIVILASCTKEWSPEAGNESLRTETLKARIEGTKVNISDAGKFSWTEGDKIAVHRSIGGYETAVLTEDGAFNIHLEEGAVRDNYALYPAAIADESLYGSSDLTVKLPNEYSIPKMGMDEYSPLPMVAVNDPNTDDLLFHHLGGVLRLVLTDIPFEMQKIVINLGKKVTGSFAVQGLDSASPYIALSDGTAEDIVFTMVSPITTSPESFIINIPVPVGSYETITYSIYDHYDNLMLQKTENIDINVERADGYQVGSELDIDVTRIPLCLKMARQGVVTVSNPLSLSMEYSLDRTNWTEFNSNFSIDLDRGKCIYFRGENDSYATSSDGKEADTYTNISCSNKAYLYGNVMSLIAPDPDVFSALDRLTAPYTFSDLFRKQSGGVVVSSGLISNHPTLDLVLPATTLSSYCYEHMFYDADLERAPVLPATNIAPHCYEYMFAYSDLKDCPELPAVTMAEACYKNMFSGCTRLQSPPELPSEDLAGYCYAGMFSYCKKLSATPTLSATTMAPYCYQSMFRGCDALTAAPELPATTLADYCYEEMFSSCKLLTASPVLQATVMAPYCYQNMFADCRAIVSPPILPAEELAKGCYSGMFSRCTSLSSAPSLQASVAPLHCYEGMFSGCTSLTEAPDLPATEVGDFSYSTMFSECSALIKAPDVLPATNTGDRTYVSMFNNCTSLTDAPVISATTIGPEACSNMFSGCTALVNVSDLQAETIDSGGCSYMFKDCTSLTEVPDLPATTLRANAYSYMFSGCTSLVEAPAILASSLVGGSFAFKGMFSGCTSLTKAPELPAETMTEGCYSYMFSGCTNLVNAPALPATTLAKSCYSYMFDGCTLLSNVPEILPAEYLRDNCYSYMFRGCTSMTTAPVLPAHVFRAYWAGTETKYSYMGMFEGCSSLQYVKAMLTAIFGTDNLKDWLSGVSSTGTFVMPGGEWTVNYNPYTDAGVPSGWTIEEATE